MDVILADQMTWPDVVAFGLMFAFFGFMAWLTLKD